MSAIVQSFTHGQVTVGTVTQVQLAATPRKLVRGIIVKSAKANTGLIYVGNSAVSTSNGYPLSADQSVQVSANDQSDVWVVSDAATQSVGWIAS